MYIKHKKTRNRPFARETAIVCACVSVSVSVCVLVCVCTASASSLLVSTLPSWTSPGYLSFFSSSSFTSCKPPRCCQGSASGDCLASIPLMAMRASPSEYFLTTSTSEPSGNSILLVQGSATITFTLQPLARCVFITAVPMTKLFAWGEGDSGGHVL